MATDSSNGSSIPSSDPTSIQTLKLAPFNPSSIEIQEKALDLLQLTETDILFDLGCGDGRLLIKAVQTIPGLRCIGIDIDPIFVERGQTTVQELSDLSLRERLDIRLGDVLQLPRILSSNDPSSSSSSSRRTIYDMTLMGDATALYLFVLPKGVEMLMPLLETILDIRRNQQKSFRIVSYMFKIHSWTPTTIDTSSKAGCPLYLYDFPYPHSETL